MKPFQSVTKLGLLARKYALATNDTALMIDDNAVTPVKVSSNRELRSWLDTDVGQ